MNKVLVNGFSNIRGGSSNFLVNLISGLSEDQFLDIHIVCFQYQAKFYEQLGNVTVHEVKQISKNRFLNRLHFELFSLPKVLLENDFKLMFNAYEVLPIVGAFMSKKNIVVYHSTLQQSTTWLRKRPITGIANRLARGFSLTKADFIVFPSEMARREIAFHNPSILNKSTVIHHGITRPDNLVKMDPVRNKNGIITVGDFYSHKNIDQVLEIFAAMLEIRNNLSLTIVGRSIDNDYYQNTLDKISKSGLEFYVKVISDVSQRELLHLYRENALYLGLSSWESFGLTPGEAMNNGCKVLIAYESGLAEIYNNLVDFVFPQLQSTIEISNLALSLMDNHTNFKNTKLPEEQYTWNNACKKYSSLIHKIIRGHDERSI